MSTASERFQKAVQALHQELRGCASVYAADGDKQAHPVFVVPPDRHDWLSGRLDALRSLYLQIPSQHPTGRDRPPFPALYVQVVAAHLSRAASASGRRLKKADLVRDLETQSARLSSARQCIRRQLGAELFELARAIDAHASPEWSVIRRQSTEWRAEIYTTEFSLPVRVFIHRAGLMLVGANVAVDIPYHDLPGGLRRRRRTHCTRLEDPEFVRGPYEFYAADRPPSAAWADRHAPADALTAPAAAPALPLLPDIDRPDVFDI